jgi:hypothetical protein
MTCLNNIRKEAGKNRARERKGRHKNFLQELMSHVCLCVQVTVSEHAAELFSLLPPPNVHLPSYRHKRRLEREGGSEQEGGRGERERERRKSY